MVLMATKKIKVEVNDGEGNRYSISFEGKVTREKAQGLLDVAELLGGVLEEHQLESSRIVASKFDRMKAVAEKCFPFVWFSSKEALVAYEKNYNEPISLSTVATYLARMVDRGFLLRQGPANSKTYRMVTKATQNELRIFADK